MWLTVYNKTKFLSLPDLKHVPIRQALWNKERMLVTAISVLAKCFQQPSLFKVIKSLDSAIKGYMALDAILSTKIKKTAGDSAEQDQSLQICLLIWLFTICRNMHSHSWQKTCAD